MQEHKYLLGIDNGGTVIKAVLFDLSGNEIKSNSVKTPLMIPQPGYLERDMELLWKSNCQCIKGLFSDNTINSEQIIAIGLSGHGKGLYAWGDGKPAYPGILSADNRAWRYPVKWKQSGAFDQVYDRLCQELVAGQPAALLAWMKDEKPEVYNSIQMIFSVKDYIRFRLTGIARSEYTDLSGSGLMDIRNKRIDVELLESLGISEIVDKIPPLCRSDELCGTISEQSANICGLPMGTPVSGGMFDIDACAIAMNVIDPDSVCMITGTWSINEFLSPEPMIGTAIAMNSIFAIPDYYLIEECSPTSAGNLDWVIDNIIDNENDKSSYESINAMVDQIRPEDCDVYFTPFLYGSNAHPLAKASFIGLTSYHTKAHLLRAVYEGVVYSAKTHLDKLLSVREIPPAIRLAGGVVNSSIWIQMFADILDMPIEIIEQVNELGALGAAISAAVASGVYQDYTEAALNMVRIASPILPDPQRTQIYLKKYQKYHAIINALDQIWDEFEI